MVQYTIQELVWAIGGTVHGIPEGSVREVATDSRAVQQGRGLLFFAIPGARHNGHDYVAELYRTRGVRRFVISEIRPEFHDLEQATFILVPSTLAALQHLAAYHRQRFSIPVVGITGSNGKTIVKEWLAAVLSAKYHTHHSPASFNSQLGVPLSILGLSPHYEVGVYEAGISQPGEMAHLAAVIRPTLGIITNLGAAHQEGFSSLRQKGEEKFQLFAHAKTLVYCADQLLVHELAQELAQKHGVELKSWSVKGNPADLAVDLQGELNPEFPGQSGASSLQFTFRWRGAHHTGTLPGTDAPTVENTLHTLLASLLLGLEPEVAVRELARLQPIPMRLERLQGLEGLPLINDTYNCDLESLQIALDFLCRQAPTTPKTLILSDILQSGLPSIELYTRVAELVATHGVDHLIGIGEAISANASLFAPPTRQAPSHLGCTPELSVRFYPDTEAFLKVMDPAALSHSAVLVKGSRPFRLERVSHRLEGRIHRTVLEVNLKAVEHNLNYFRGLLKPGVKLLVLLKAFAYGNGSAELAAFLQYHRIDYIGVAFADEGVELRRAGVQVPILVLNPAPDSYASLIAHRLEPELFSLAVAYDFARVAHEAGCKGYPVHIKLDTGMHRVGLQLDDIRLLQALLADSPSIRVASIFTHLAVADDPSQDPFTLAQLGEFKTMSDSICQSLPYRPMLHVLNSAGIERFPEYQFDMVRLGIGLHGVSANPGVQLQPVATLKSFVAQVKTLQPGDTVGYGRRGVVEEPTTIATIPIGYAAGYTRHLGNGQGKVLINGQLCPTIGSICMDTCMVNVGKMGINVGDSVTIFGEKPTIFDIAEWLNTIPYEVLTSISPRVNRIYFTD